MQSRSFLLWGVSLTNRVLTPQQKAQATGSRAREAGKRAALRVRPAGLSSEPGPRASCRLLSVCCAGSSTQRQQFACTKRLHCFGNIRFCVDCCSSSCALKSVRSVCCALSARLQHRIGSERSSPAHPFPGDVVFLLCTFAEYENFLQLKFCIIGKIPAVLYQCCDHSFIQFFMQITHSL